MRLSLLMLVAILCLFIPIEIAGTERNGYEYSQLSSSESGSISVTMGYAVAQVGRYGKEKENDYWDCYEDGWYDRGLRVQVCQLDVRGGSRYGRAKSLGVSGKNIQKIKYYDVPGLEDASLGFSDEYRTPGKCTICENAFSMVASTIKKLFIHKSIQSIGSGAFSGMKSGTIFFDETKYSDEIAPPSMSKNAFDDEAYRNVVVVVPNNRLTAFEESNWKAFDNLITTDQYYFRFLQTEYVVGIGFNEKLLLNTDKDSSEFNWTSSNTEIVEVIDGFVTGKSIGEATITATNKYGYSVSCNVSVVQPITSIKLKIGDEEIEDSSIEMKIGSLAQISAICFPENAYDENLTWESSNPDIVEYEDGVIYAKAIGSARIKVMTPHGISACCDICVIPINAEKIVLSQYEWVGSVNDCLQIKATVLPDNTTDKSVVWTSDNNSVAVVDDNGIINAISKGSAIVTASCGDVKATCLVTVVRNPADGICIRHEAVSLEVGEATLLSATVLPETTPD
ncbi:MAG: Ig-like domain-containing protein, partial [Muribaculaceae bacterium]|nr:Ig-like domain-containing protein [Muribaculaceae bacterium]